MTIIMHYVETETQAAEAFSAVQYAIKNDIQQGRYNFKSYGYSSGKDYTVCKNKDSFTVYRQKRE